MLYYISSTMPVNPALESVAVPQRKSRINRQLLQQWWWVFCVMWLPSIAFALCVFFAFTNAVHWQETHSALSAALMFISLCGAPYFFWKVGHAHFN